MDRSKRILLDRRKGIHKLHMKKHYLQIRISKGNNLYNGPQFVISKIKEFCEERNIKRDNSPMYHPETNGQAESSNKVLLNSLKKRLEVADGNWSEELPGVLRA